MARSEPTDGDAMWELMLEGSDELAEEVGLPERPSPRALERLDRWIGEHDGALDADEVAQLGMYLARLLVELHDGGLMRIEVKGHALEGEWAVTGFRRGLAEDYVVPFVVSAARIGVDRSLSARQWYQQLCAEGRR